MKTNFHNKNFALSLALIMRFTATWNWPIVVSVFTTKKTVENCVAIENFSLFLRSHEESTY